MKTKKAETVKIATDEMVSSTTKEGLINELGTKRHMLKDKETRLNGGQCFNINYIPIGREIDRLSKIIKMREIELRLDIPSSVKYAFEEDIEWLTLRRGFAQEDIDEFKKKLINLMEQKERIIIEIDQLKARIKEIEKELGGEYNV